MAGFGGFHGFPPSVTAIEGPAAAPRDYIRRDGAGLRLFQPFSWIEDSPENTEMMKSSGPDDGHSNSGPLLAQKWRWLQIRTAQPTPSARS